MAAIHPSVTAAFRDSGSRKAGTALLIASTPVRAVQPDEKAFNRRKSVRGSVPPGRAGAGAG